MNIDGIYNESDFKKGMVDIDRPKRKIDAAKESVRFLPDRSKITLICERSSNAKFTRIRDILFETTSSQ